MLCTKEGVSTALEVSLSIDRSIMTNLERNAGNGYRTALVARDAKNADRIRAFTTDYPGVPTTIFKNLMNCTDLEELFS